MREKLESLPLAEIKEIAKQQGIKGITKLKKNEIIDKILEAADNDNGENIKNQEKQETKSFITFIYTFSFNINHSFYN